MGVSKPTEMTIRDLLQEELRKRGVTVVPEFSVSTPTGRLMPDSNVLLIYLDHNSNQ